MKMVDRDRNRGCNDYSRSYYKGFIAGWMPLKLVTGIVRVLPF